MLLSDNNDTIQLELFTTRSIYMVTEFVENVRLGDDGVSVVILDQTLLPNETKYLRLCSAAELYEAIASLRVRGAPAIGIFAAYALYVLARQAGTEVYDTFLAYILKQSAYLDSSRPTAVNLHKQLSRMVSVVESMPGAPIPLILDVMRGEAETIQNEDIEMCRAISRHGLSLIRDGCGIMTYCNAGPLATSRYGTGLGPILLAQERGIQLNVYCCETRPLLQGARLTTYELSKAGVDCVLICDNMASSVMKEGRIDAVFVGCDRAAHNGDVANKIGTSGLAVLAKHYGVPFYVFCPSSTIDQSCANGDEIEIEQRPPDEIKSMFFTNPIAPVNVRCYNPSFDVTDNNLITAIVTEKGICRPPFTKSLGHL